MRTIHLSVVLAIVVVMGHSCVSHGQQSSETGTVTLHAIDIDSGEPIAGVTFAIENSLAEDWAVAIGKSGEDGTLRMESKPRRGYFYSIFQMPRQYKVVGLDAVPSGIVPGKAVEHKFHLRRRDAVAKIPEFVPRPRDAVRQLPAPTQLDNSVYFQSSTCRMPGFEEQQVRFRFYPNPNGDIEDKRLRIAEDTMRNGMRLRAALGDELLYFRKAEGEKAGNIQEIKDVIIDVGQNGVVVGCRTKGCLKLRKDGFQVRFDTGLIEWDLYVPDYLHPEFGE